MRSLNRVAAAGWLAATPAALLNTRPLLQTTFGLPTQTFEDNLREPAAGLLELTAPLFPLAAVLLLALAAKERIGLPPDDEVRAGGTLAATSAAALATLALNAALGLTPTPEGAPLVAVAVGLLGATCAVGYAAATSSEVEPLELFKEDAAELVSDIGGPEEDQVSFFYRSSALVGLLVGASFLVSPISPISLFETEAPVTHMFRQDVGAFICFLLCPIQAALFRAAKTDSLTDPLAKGLNAVTGLCILGLVLDGRAQTNFGTEQFQLQQPGTAFYDTLTSLLGDPAAVGRSQTNTQFAFLIGFAVGLFYLFQSLRVRRA